MNLLGSCLVVFLLAERFLCEPVQFAALQLTGHWKLVLWKSQFGIGKQSDIKSSCSIERVNKISPKFLTR
jgi:hypothetical protein